MKARYLQAAVWWSVLALAAGASGDSAPSFRIVSYMDRYDQPVGIVEGSAGVFYSNAGAIHPVVFSFEASGRKTMLAAFASGEHVLGPLVSAANGRFYSAIQRGGGTPAAEFSVGAAPDTKLAYAAQNLSPMLTQNLPDGSLLGVAFSSGPYSLVRSDLDGNVTSIYKFPAGERVPATAIYATDGNFYGAATHGGDGYLWRLTASGSLEKLVELRASFAIEYTFAPLLEAGDGNIYGVTPLGGAHGAGTLYKLTAGGHYMLLYSFTGGANSHPTALIEGSDGNLYGAAEGAGAASQLFRLTTSGEYTALYEMKNPGTDGQCPCSLTQASDGIIYGTAAGFGITGAGALFALDVHLRKPAPRALDFTPKTGAAGTRVRIWGYHLLNASVRFHGLAAEAVSGGGPNYLWATVPRGATSGPIAVAQAGGTNRTKAEFTVR